MSAYGSSERSFFSAMSDFGFFSHIYEKLPQEFTAVFEIARVIEDENSALHLQLKHALTLPSLQSEGRRDTFEDFHTYVPMGDEYEADLIQSPHHISRIYSWQYLLPQDLFDQRLAERTLWMPIAKSPRIAPVEDLDNRFAYDSNKQKVYVLFDTSSSMTAHHRIHLAKAIVSYFLKENLSDLGHISFRTFDDHVGELHTAIDHDSYCALLRHILRLSHLGDGTVLQRAIITALDDIQSMDHLSGAEILVITDGAVSLDETAIRAKMDEHIRIHTVKIGNAHIFPSDALVEEQVADRTKDKLILDLKREESELSDALRHTHAHERKHQLEQNLSSVRARLGARKRELGEEYRLNYGDEIRKLSSVYVNVDDFDDTHLFRATSETIADLEDLADSLIDESREFLTSDVTKKLAVLHDHILFLMKYETDEALKERLRALDERLRKLLAEAMGEIQPQPDTTQAIGEAHAIPLPMTEEDLRDMQFLLETGAGDDSSAWGRLLRMIWNAAVKRVMRWQRKP